MTVSHGRSNSRLDHSSKSFNHWPAGAMQLRALQHRAVTRTTPDPQERACCEGPLYPSQRRPAALHTVKSSLLRHSQSTPALRTVDSSHDSQSVHTRPRLPLAPVSLGPGLLRGKQPLLAPAATLPRARAVLHLARLKGLKPRKVALAEPLPSLAASPDSRPSVSRRSGTRPSSEEAKRYEPRTARSFRVSSRTLFRPRHLKRLKRLKPPIPAYCTPAGPHTHNQPQPR